MPLATITTLDKPLIELTPAAITEAKRILGKQDDPEAGIRIGVRGGGCSGLNYDMKVDAKRDGDHTWEFDGLKVYVDKKSIFYVAGMVLDFTDDLLMGGFKFNNPNATRSCGCGTSFSV